MVSHQLSELAWGARENARVRSGTAVGVSVMDQRSRFWAACNIELEFRLGMHAEVNALSVMVASYPDSKVWAMCIAADAERFTPCGSCLDWIMQLAVPGCTIFVERAPGDISLVTSPPALMPLYPSKGL